MIVKSIVVLSSLLSLCFADTNATIQQESNYIDETHTVLSKKVIEWSDTIDTTLSNWVGNDEPTTTAVGSNVFDNRLENKVKTVDSFFQNNKYINETEETFIRVRTGSSFQSKKPNDFDIRLKAQLPLSKSKKRFKIFVDDVTSDNIKNILRDDPEDDHPAPDIGVHYFLPKTYGIESKYSLGFNGIHPFVKARYNLPFKINGWLIDPVQVFKYSVNDKFEGETNIYFDKQFKESSLFRIQLHGKTQTEMDSIDYGLLLHYYWSPKKDTGLRFSQLFMGNTKYQYRVDKNVEVSQTKDYSGINNYVTSFSWRENIWRKWFYYEVRTGVNFEKQYDYEPNYSIILFLDFYFGQYH